MREASLTHRYAFSLHLFPFFLPPNCSLPNIVSCPRKNLTFQFLRSLAQSKIAFAMMCGSLHTDTLSCAIFYAFIFTKWIQWGMRLARRVTAVRTLGNLSSALVFSRPSDSHGSVFNRSSRTARSSTGVSVFEDRDFL